MRFCPAFHLLPGFDGDMADLIARIMAPAQGLCPVAHWQKLAEHKLRATITLPRRNIFCVGKNYHEHAGEFNNQLWMAYSL